MVAARSATARTRRSSARRASRVRRQDAPRIISSGALALPCQGFKPYFRKGRYYLPAVVWNPNVPGGVGSLAYWSIAEESDEAHREGQIIYRPYKGPSKNQMAAEKTGQ